MSESKLNIKFKGDWYLLTMIVLLIGMGVLVVYSSVTAKVVSSGGDTNTERLFIEHLVMLGLGVIAMIVCYKIDYKWFGLLSLPLLILSLILMILVSIPGIGMEINSAARWLLVPGVNKSFQPSDLAKVAVIIHLAASLSKLQNSTGDFSKVLFKSVGLPILIIVLIALNDMSTALLLMVIVGIVMFIGRVQAKVFLSFIGVLFAFAPFVYFLSKRVQTAVSRVTDFLAFSNDPGVTELPYQVEQANIALALGGLSGVGLGHSQQRYFLPEAFSDYIYAIVVEEYGFIIGVFILLIYLGILFRGMLITQKTKNAFSGLLVVGLSMLIVLQAVTHMAVVTGVGPVTGLPLPWVSMGGTSLLFTGIEFGIILSVTREINTVPVGKDK